MGKVISFMNQKGGVGKTTTTLNVGVGLKNLGKKVLLIDLDPQVNLTLSLGFKDNKEIYSIYDLLKGDVDFNSICLDYQGLSLIPSSFKLSGAEATFSSIAGREFLLKEAIEGVKDQFDCVLIDCPPNIGLLSLNALTASDEVYIPINAEYLPLEGVSLLLETVEVVRKRLNQNLQVGGVIVTMYKSRQLLNKEVVGLIKDHFEEKLFNTLIRVNVSLAEAPSFGQDIFTYMANSSGAEDYKNLCLEFIDRGVI